MKHNILVAAVMGALLSLSSSAADAFVCVRGVYRAGCVGPYGAVGVARGGYVAGGAVCRRGGFYRGGTVVRRTTVVRRGVYRRW